MIGSSYLHTVRLLHCSTHSWTSEKGPLAVATAAAPTFAVTVLAGSRPRKYL